MRKPGKPSGAVGVPPVEGVSEKRRKRRIVLLLSLVSALAACALWVGYGAYSVATIHSDTPDSIGACCQINRIDTSA